MHANYAHVLLKFAQIAKFMGPTWVLSAPDGPHVGPMNLAIWVGTPSMTRLPHPFPQNPILHVCLELLWYLGYVNTRSAARFREITTANLNNAICSRYVTRNLWKPEQQGKIYNCQHCACSSPSTASTASFSQLTLVYWRPSHTDSNDREIKVLTMNTKAYLN